MGALTANPNPRTKTPPRRSTGFSNPAQPSKAGPVGHAASHRLVVRSIRPLSKASASAPAGSANKKNGNDARLVMTEIRKLDGDMVFIIHVAAVSWAATAVPEARLASQIFRKA